MRILVTAGPTREAIDPVRYLSNRSSGKMGYAIAQAAVELGHEVLLVSGPTELIPPGGIKHFFRIETAFEMFVAMRRMAPGCDCVIMSAAVADYRPKVSMTQKMKKNCDNLVLELEPTQDILKYLGEHKPQGQILVGFAAETEYLEARARSKLVLKNLDWVIANDVSRHDRGFDVDDNAVTLFGRDGTKLDLPLSPKIDIARHILPFILTTKR